MNQQVKAGIAAVRDFLSGRSGEAKAAQSSDQATRAALAEELLSAMARTPESGEGSEQQQSIEQERERARHLYLEHGYFDEAVEALRGAKSPAERARAAKALGLLGSQRATAHLIAAMFDDDAEVREVAEKALAQISESKATETDSKAMDATTPLLSQTTEQTVESVAVAEPPTGASTEEPAAHGREHHAKPSSIERFRLRKSKDSSLTKAKSVESGAPEAAAPGVVNIEDPTAPEEEKQLFGQERSALAALEQLKQKLAETAEALTASHNEARWRAERESKLRQDGEARRRELEEARQKAEQENAKLLEQEIAAITAEVSARVTAETEAHNLAEQQKAFWLEASTLKSAAEEASAKRWELESARRAAVRAAELDAAQKARTAAENQHNEDVTLLRAEEERLRIASEEASARRAEVEVARERAERDAEQLLQAQERMRVAEQGRINAEKERAQLEAELHQRVQAEEKRLAEARERAEQEQARMAEDARLFEEAEERRLADAAASRDRAELEHKRRLEEEKEIRAQIDKLRIAEAEARKRITEAESRKHTAEQSYRVVADKVQRFEAEAHAAAVQEEQILAKLESARRNAANEAQARAEQEKRVKEEIQMFRRLEDEERPRLEALTLQRAEAESRLQETREKLRQEEEMRAFAQDEIQSFTAAAEPTEFRETPQAPGKETFDEEISHVVSPNEPEVLQQPVFTTSSDAHQDVPAAIASYLHSVDPYKRAAAVAELARSNANDAFALIAKCFDDHSPHVRNAAARALRKLEPNKTVDLFNRAIEEGSEERRKNIGSAIAASGVASEAIENLAGDSREDTYNALSILFVMAKSDEVEPLVRAVEEHENEEICRAALKLLTLSGKSEVGDAALQRRLMGVPATRQKQPNGGHNEIPDFRLRIAEVEVKRALNHHQTTDAGKPDS